MKSKQFTLYGSATLLIALIGISIGGYWWQASDNQPAPMSGSVPVLRKSIDFPQNSASLSAGIDLTIFVNGLQTRDVVNIRPGGDKKVMVAAGSILPGDNASPTHGLMVRSGPALADSSLRLTPDAVTFNRPTRFDNVVFLDIQLPTTAKVQVVIDGDTKLKGSLARPLLLRNQEWVEGAQTAPGAMARAAMPRLDKSKELDRPVLDQSSGYYAVSFSSLRALEREDMAPKSRSVVIVLYIDESGRVEKTVPLTSLPTTELEQKIKKWRFAPYLIDGRPVRVSAMLTL